MSMSYNIYKCCLCFGPKFASASYQLQSWLVKYLGSVCLNMHIGNMCIGSKVYMCRLSFGTQFASASDQIQTWLATDFGSYCFKMCTSEICPCVRAFARVVCLLIQILLRPRIKSSLDLQHGWDRIVSKRAHRKYVQALQHSYVLFAFWSKICFGPW